MAVKLLLRLAKSGVRNFWPVSQIYKSSSAKTSVLNWWDLTNFPNALGSDKFAGNLFPQKLILRSVSVSLHKNTHRNVIILCHSILHRNHLGKEFLRKDDLQISRVGSTCLRRFYKQKSCLMNTTIWTPWIKVNSYYKIEVWNDWIKNAIHKIAHLKNPVFIIYIFVFSRIRSISVIEIQQSTYRPVEQISSGFRIDHFGVGYSLRRSKWAALKSLV